MQNIVIEKPYEFVPPHRGNLWPTMIQRFRLIDRWLRKSHGVTSYECRGVEKLRESLAAGHGIMLTPNHCRPSDPIVMGFPAREAKTHVYAMASWHLYNQDRFTAFAIRKMGGFSVNREGVDRKSLNTAIDVLESAERPLIVFPEGVTTRLNDRLLDFLDGVAFIARTAARRRAKRLSDGKVVIHPVAIKYLFHGDLRTAIEPQLADFERRLTWKVSVGVSLLDRIRQIGDALLSLKELEYLGTTQTGSTSERCQQLIDMLLTPIEEDWLGGEREQGVVARVKSLRMAIVPELTRNEVSGEERTRRWNQLADIYLAQQLSCYPEGYLRPPTSVDRILETVERLEEDLTDQVTSHPPTKVVIQIGDAVEVSTSRDRNAETDPLMTQIYNTVQGMLDELSRESVIFEE
ncbi:MAG: 1-acyl-sn-glycerol-3-phosphate acyltransferase [Pirellulaceae bacterium]|nr:1-acyl-sn-glycerol-3-phosphate acyltransferase [Pirellulaceae bacterium]